MTLILVLLTVLACVGIQSMVKRISRAHTVEERRIRRVRWGLTEEAFLK
jgi:hypothetical protein